MADICIETEIDSHNGWVFTVRIDSVRTLDIRLSWSDYDLWGRGSIPPADVVRALVRVLLKTDALLTLGSAFDASTARRLVRSLDTDIPEQLAEN